MLHLNNSETAWFEGVRCTMRVPPAWLVVGNEIVVVGGRTAGIASCQTKCPDDRRFQAAPSRVGRACFVFQHDPSGS